jgi:hypothetical protein
MRAESAVEFGRNIHELIGADAAFRHSENAEGEMSADNLGTLLRRLTEQSTHEIEKLIDELQTLRKKLETEGDRIQSAIARHSELSQGALKNSTEIYF